MRSAIGFSSTAKPFRATSLPALALSVGMFLGSRPAAAQHTTSYTGSQCQPIGSSSVESNSWNEFYIGGDDGIVANRPDGTPDTDLWIVCPIFKTTSGPTIYSGDEISDIEVTINNDDIDPGIYCQTIVYNSHVPASVDDTNVEYEVDHQSDFEDALISWSDGIGGSGWWGAGSESTNTWFYAQLECDLQWGEELVSYEVIENGSETSKYIAPAMATCATENSGHFQENITDLGEEGPAGYAEDPGSTRGWYACETPQDYVQYSLIPAIDPADGFEWSWSSSGQGSPASWTCTGNPISGPSGFAFRGISGVGTESSVFPGSTFDLPASVPSGDTASKFSSTWLDAPTEYVWFRQCSTEGDFSIVSYRTSD
jgi:hypothetical protein